MDEILANRAQISRQVLPVVAGHAGAFGLRVHAVDIARAHLLALERIDTLGLAWFIFAVWYWLSSVGLT